MVAGQRRERARIGLRADDSSPREPAAEPERGLAGVRAEVDDEPRIAVIYGLVLALAEDLAQREQLAPVAEPEPSAPRRQAYAHRQRHVRDDAALQRQQLDRRRREEPTRGARGDCSSEGGAVALALPGLLERTAADQAHPCRTTQGPENVRGWAGGTAPR